MRGKPGLFSLDLPLMLTECLGSWEDLVRLEEEGIFVSYKKDRFTQWQSFNLRSHKNQEAIKLLKLK